MEIYVGCCGFPVSKKKYYENFKAVEVQSTFYTLPSLKLAEKWRREAPRGFVFCVKCFQGVTHPITSPTWKKCKSKLTGKKENYGLLRPTKEVLGSWKKTYEVCKVLEARVCLIQTPASFKDTEENLERAREFFSRIERGEMEVAVELRGWEKDSVRKLCKEFKLVECVDPILDLPSCFGKKKIAYFRLHGSYERGRINYKHKFTEEELAGIKEKVFGLKVREAFVLFNNVYMFEDAIRFMRLLQS